MPICTALHDALTWWAPVVSGYVPALALVFAVARGSREWSRWKRERQLTKRSEVAAEVLGAAMRFADGLRANASPWVVGSSREKPKPSEAVTEREEIREGGQDLSEVFGVRWEAFTPVRVAFTAAMDQAEIFLPESINELLDELWKEYSGLHASQNAYVMTLRQGTHLEELYEDSLGSELQSRLTTLRTRVRAALRPLAQLEN